jgi:sulfate adenylyltransferase
VALWVPMIIHSVLKEMRLCNGLIWSLPIVLPVEDALAEHLKSFGEAVLEDSSGEILGKITIEDIYKADKEKEAETVFLTSDTSPSRRSCASEAG